MYHAYIDLLERAHEYDVRVSRAQAKKENLRDRLKNSAFTMTDRKFIKRYRLSKALVRMLVDELTPLMPPTLRSDALDVETKVM